MKKNLDINVMVIKIGGMMYKELDEILNDLESIGSDKDELKKIRKIIIPILDKSNDLDIIINEIIAKIVIESKRFLNLKNKDNINYLTGFSSSIYLPTFDNSGEVNILLTGGVRSRINENSECISSRSGFININLIKLVFTLVLLLLCI